MTWDEYFFLLADTVALKSKDPSSKFGCVLVDQDHRILSIGFNGFPVGVLDSEERYHDRETKYKFVVHAEMNAIATAARNGVALKNSSAYIQAIPCAECAKALIQAGIKKVFIKKENFADYLSRWGTSCEITLQMFAEAGVEIREIALDMT